LERDLKRGSAYKARTNWLASLAFGTVPALKKIRRIWVGSELKGVVGDVVEASENEKKLMDLSVQLEGMDSDLHIIGYNLVCVIKARRLLKLRRTLEYDIAVTERRVYAAALLSSREWLEGTRVVLAELDGILYDTENRVVRR